MQYLNAFFLLTDRPEAYNLPAAPTRPSNRIAPALTAGLATLAGLALAAVALMAGGDEERRHGR
jgi:formate dehydrogenase iron-sulfur subunit